MTRKCYPNFPFLSIAAVGMDLKKRRRRTELDRTVTMDQIILLFFSNTELFFYWKCTDTECQIVLLKLNWLTISVKIDRNENKPRCSVAHDHKIFGNRTWVWQQWHSAILPYSDTAINSVFEHYYEITNWIILFNLNKSSKEDLV